MTVLIFGSALTDTSLTAPVVRSATSAVLLSGPMIRPLVLSRQPCITPGAGQAFGNGLGGSGGGGGGVEDGPGASSGSVVNGWEIALSNFAQPAEDPQPASPRTARPAPHGSTGALACPPGYGYSAGVRHDGVPRRRAGARSGNIHRRKRRSNPRFAPSCTYSELCDESKPRSAAGSDPTTPRCDRRRPGWSIPKTISPSATYGGDFETTKIPPYSPGYASSDPAPSTGYGLLHDPEPLPYVQPHAEPAAASPPAAPMEIEPVDAEERAKAAGRRGTQDLGLLLLRVALGVVFIAHGLQKAFGWWGGQGIDGFKTALTDAGYQHAGLLTYVGAGAQIAVGVLLVLGLFTPLAAAVALAYLVNSLLTVFSAQRRGRLLFGVRRRRHGVPAGAHRRGGLDHPGRPGPLRVRRRPRLGPPTVHRLGHRADARHRRRRGRLAVPARKQPAGIACAQRHA